MPLRDSNEQDFNLPLSLGKLLQPEYEKKKALKSVSNVSSIRASIYRSLSIFPICLVDL